jgi:hypothetical protein
MAFGKHEIYNENYIEYKESVDMLLHDLKLIGHKDLTKQELINILTTDMSIGRAVRKEIDRILNGGI